jgi:hypothetical protein
MSGRFRYRLLNPCASTLAGLAPGHYTLRASVDWQQHKLPGLPTWWATSYIDAIGLRDLFTTNWIDATLVFTYP